MTRIFHEASLRASPARRWICVDLSESKARQSLGALEVQVGVLLCDACLWIEKGQPQTSFVAQPCIERCTVIDEFRVARVIDKVFDFS